MGNNVEGLGKWAYEVVSEKAQPYQFDSGGFRLIFLRSHFM